MYIYIECAVFDFNAIKILDLSKLKKRIINFITEKSQNVSRRKKKMLILIEKFFLLENLTIT